ncbi:MAG: hypothetical protein ABIJ23_00885 [Candidatus Magasanikbacteria bacterium]
MKDNFLFGIKAINYDIKIFMLDLLQNKILLGFIFGLLITALTAGFILTKNPKNIPIILRYSSMEAFEKISKRDKNGTYQLAFTNFLKIYTQTRTLLLITLISFFVMVTTIVIV